MKAFLSHSSKDKGFVKAVSNELGRQFCLVDEQAFTTGDEFKVSIDKSLDRSSIFVLFASKESLQSIWVGYEQDEAWIRKISHFISSGLVYIIQSGVEISDIPEWLRKGLIKHEISPQVIAREIRHKLEQSLNQRQHPFFVNRTSIIQHSENVLLPTDGSPAPRSFFIIGLPGIGRRTLIRHLSARIFGLSRTVELRIEEGDSLQDICIKSASLAEPYSTKDGLKAIMDEINALSDADACFRCLENLRSISRGGELPILINAGGLIDYDGSIAEPVSAVLKGIAVDDDLCLALVAERMPQLTDDIKCPVIRVDPLHPDSIARLIGLHASKIGVSLEPGHVLELAEYVAGYPPAASYAVQLTHLYGIDAVLEDKRKLVEFRTVVFIKHLANLRLNDEQKTALRDLANFSPLPLSTIGEVVGKQGSDLVKCICGLIDLALVVVTSDNLYAIADPVATAILRAFKYLEKESAARIAQHLFTVLDTENWGRSQLELSRVLFAAASYCGDDKLAAGTIHLASDLIRLTERFYHQRKYALAEKCARTALAQRPKSISTMSWLISALIQQEKWGIAEEELDRLAVIAPVHDVFYFKGFLARKQGNARDAIREYNAAEKFGRKGASIKRELAVCHLLEGNLAEAKRYIDEALDRHGDNSYLLDLQIQIATKRLDEEAARNGLAKMEAIDKGLFYYHRLSVVELTFGNLKAAHAAALTAVETDEMPPFEAIFHLACCDIQLGKLTEAGQLLDVLDRDFAAVRHDLRATLRCRHDIAKGDFSAALNRTDHIKDKTSIFYKAVRSDALSGVLQKDVLPDVIRQQYKAEKDRLAQEISQFEGWTSWSTELNSM